MMSGRTSATTHAVGTERENGKHSRTEIRDIGMPPPFPHFNRLNARWLNKAIISATDMYVNIRPIKVPKM